MSHIEFIGPPGAGKSSLYRGLIADSSYSGWDSVSAVRLVTPNLLGPIVSRTPDSIVRAICHKLWYYWAMDCLYEDFLKQYPSYQVATEAAMSVDTTNQAKLQWLLKSTGTQYHVATTTSRRNEQVCLDEGFYFRALSVAMRTEWELPTKKYFENVPEPAAIIKISAPIDLCLKRQQQRGSKVRRNGLCEKETIKQTNKLLHELSSIAKGRDITVIEIENTYSIQKTIKNVEIALENI